MLHLRIKEFPASAVQLVWNFYTFSLFYSVNTPLWISGMDPRVRIITTRTEIKVGRIGRNGSRLQLRLRFFTTPRRCLLYFLARLLMLTSGCQLASKNRRGLIEGWRKHGRGRHPGRGTFPLNFSRLDTGARAPNKTALYRIRVYRYGKSSSLGDKVCPL